MKIYSRSLFFTAGIAMMLLSSCNKKNFDSGVRGNVDYGEGDCMPGTSQREKKFKNYKGELFFIVKSELDALGNNGDFEALKQRSIKDEVWGGRLSVALPPNTYVVVPAGFHSATEVIVVGKGKLIKKDFKFWKCTSY